MTSDEALIEKMAEAINEARLHQLATSTELARAALSVVRENDKMVQAGRSSREPDLPSSLTVRHRHKGGIQG